jgi:hypothetical protein
LGEPNRDSVHDYGVEGGSIIVGGDKADNSSNKQGGTFYWAEINVMRPALGPFVVLVPIFLVLGPLGGGSMRHLCSGSRLAHRGGGCSSRSHLCSGSRFWCSLWQGSEGDHVSRSRPSFSDVELGKFFSHHLGVLWVHFAPRLVGEVAALVAGSAYPELQAHSFGCLMSRVGQSWPSVKII